MFLEGQHQRVEKKGSSKEGDKQIKLVHTDWMCKVPDMRLKFLPDFETLKKPGFGLISKFRLLRDTSHVSLTPDLSSRR